MLLVVHDEENALKRSRKDEIDVGRFSARRPFLYWLRRDETRRWVSIYRWRQERKGEEKSRKKIFEDCYFTMLWSERVYYDSDNQVKSKAVFCQLFCCLSLIVLRFVRATVDASMWSLDACYWSNGNANRSFSFHEMLNVRTIFPITTPIISPCCSVLSAFLTLLECS